jgi:hypothetical protein
MQTIRLGGLVAAVLMAAGFACATPALAGGRTVHGTQNMSPVRPLTDDKCDAACDAASDKCAIEAGKDAAKQRQCDAAYDTCLRNCQGPG